MIDGAGAPDVIAIHVGHRIQHLGQGHLAQIQVDPPLDARMHRHAVTTILHQGRKKLAGLDILGRNPEAALRHVGLGDGNCRRSRQQLGLHRIRHVQCGGGPLRLLQRILGLYRLRMLVGDTTAQQQGQCDHRERERDLAH